MLLNAFSRLSKCLFHETEADSYWIDIPNYLHIVITVVVVFFFKLPSTKKKITSLSSSGTSSSGNE